MLIFPDKNEEGFRILRQALGYCWSVGIVAYTEEGRHYFERWAQSSDQDIQWLLRSNLTKERLVRMDAAWVKTMRIQLRQRTG